jgi:hypothetical protein
MSTFSFHFWPVARFENVFALPRRMANRQLRKLVSIELQ